MLNEIFKGMDNAAEIINDNFDKLSFEKRTDENGTYVSQEGGVTIMTRKVTITQGGSRETFSYPLIAEEANIFCGYSYNGTLGSASTVELLKNLEVSNHSSNTGWEVRATPATSDYNGMTLTLVAIFI